MEAEPESLWGCGRGPAPFLEGHPRIKAAELADNLAQGSDLCTWYWPDDGAPFARAGWEQPQSDMVIGRLEAALPNVAENGYLLAYVLPGPRDARVRAFSLFRCPTCRGPTQHLVYVLGWTCDRCSPLKYRSQKVSAEVARWERLGRLDAWVGQGRPKGMHRTTFSALRKERAELRGLLGKERIDAPLEYRLTLQRRWTPTPAWMRLMRERQREAEACVQAAPHSSTVPEAQAVVEPTPATRVPLPLMDGQWLEGLEGSPFE